MSDIFFTPSHTIPSFGEVTYTVYQDSNQDGTKDNHSSITYPKKDRKFFDGFEDGDVSEWKVNDNDFSAKTNNAFESTFSGGIESSGANQKVAEITPADLAGGLQPDYIRWYYLEQSNSFGGGIRLLNSNGNSEGGWATNNPEFAITDGTGSVTFDKPKEQIYETWHLVEILFDWQNSSYDILWQDIARPESLILKGRSLKNGLDVETISIENYDNGFSGGSNMFMWFDNIEVYEAESGDGDKVSLSGFTDDGSTSDWWIDIEPDNRATHPVDDVKIKSVDIEV